MDKYILDVGCGGSKIPGAIGIDQFDMAEVDIVHDLNKLPWPIPEESVDRIVFSHSISHLRDVPAILTECNRILVNGGEIEIVAPHFSSDNFKTDPTHVVSMGVRSMNYFVSNVEFQYRYLHQDKLFELVESGISFREHTSSWRDSRKFNAGELLGLEALINSFPRIYEKFLCSFIPASEVYFRLRKKKISAL